MQTPRKKKISKEHLPPLCSGQHKEHSCKTMFNHRSLLAIFNEIPSFGVSALVMTEKLALKSHPVPSWGAARGLLSPIFLCRLQSKEVT